MRWLSVQAGKFLEMSIPGSHSPDSLLEWTQETLNNRVLREFNANRVLLRECTGHSKHPFPTTQEKTLNMDITRCSILKSDWLYSLQPKIEKLYTVSKNNLGADWLRSWTPYCQIQAWIEESRKNYWTIWVGPKSNPLRLHNGSDKQI